MDWRKIWVVARHEYLVNVRRAGFIIMTAIVPLLGAGTLLFMTLFAGEAQQLGDKLAEQFDMGRQTTGVVDQSGYFSPILPAYRDEGQFVPYASEALAEAALLDEEVEVVLVIGADYVETGQVVVVSTGSGFGAAAVSDSSTMRAFFVDHLLRDAVDPALRNRAANPLDVEPRVISSGGETQGEGTTGFLFTFVIPYLLSVFLVVTIFVSSGYLLQSVAEEKESRVVEIVVSSVRP
ncbi:MAG: ABC transporter permease, partial [Dehalococcoidia bacterium]